MMIGFEQSIYYKLMEMYGILSSDTTIVYLCQIQLQLALELTVFSLWSAVKARTGSDSIAIAQIMILQNAFSWKYIAALSISIHVWIIMKMLLIPNIKDSLTNENGSATESFVADPIFPMITTLIYSESL